MDVVRTYPIDRDRERPQLPLGHVHRTSAKLSDFVDPLLPLPPTAISLFCSFCLLFEDSPSQRGRHMCNPSPATSHRRARPLRPRKLWSGCIIVERANNAARLSMKCERGRQGRKEGRKEGWSFHFSFSTLSTQIR